MNLGASVKGDTNVRIRCSFTDMQCQSGTAYSLSFSYSQLSNPQTSGMPSAVTSLALFIININTRGVKTFHDHMDVRSTYIT